MSGLLCTGFTMINNRKWSKKRPLQCMLRPRPKEHYRIQKVPGRGIREVTSNKKSPESENTTSFRTILHHQSTHHDRRKELPSFFLSVKSGCIVSTKNSSHQNRDSSIINPPHSQSPKCASKVPISYLSVPPELAAGIQIPRKLS